LTHAELRRWLRGEDFEDLRRPKREDRRRDVAAEHMVALAGKARA